MPNSLTSDEIYQHLLTRGIEVDAVETIEPAFEGIIVGLVESVEKHPKADRLVVAKVFDGKERYQVVCGAPNCRQGLKVPFAKIGARIGAKEAPNAFIIKQASLRGIDSFGMLCAADELGLGAYEKQLLELDDTFTPGQNFDEFCRDTILELSLTPDLGHALSIYGIARELAAATGLPLQLALSLPTLQAGPVSDPIWSVEIKQPELCNRYSLLVIEDFQNSISPFWMQQLLTRAGYRPKNLAVDCANFVMVSLGQPLHTFDRRAFKEPRIELSLSNCPQEVKLLDGSVKMAPEGLLLIKSSTDIEAVAGLIGCESSAVNNETRALVVEAAHFSSSAIRRAKTALHISTESSRRFERGTDPEITFHALSFFFGLLKSTSNSAQITAALDYLAQPLSNKQVSLTLERAQLILGRAISTQDIEWVLHRLGYSFQWEEGNTCIVHVPLRRHDINADIDLIDELWKLLPADQAIYHSQYAPSPHTSHPLYTLERQVRQTVVSLGLQEWMCCSLISPKAAECCVRCAVAEPKSLVSVQNPMSQEQSVLRPSLFPGLIESYVRNCNVKLPDCHAFEIGTIHMKTESGFVERMALGILLAGEHAPHAFDREIVATDFFDLKGIIEQFCTQFEIAPRFEKNNSPLFHPGQQARIFIGSICIGALGALHPAVVREFQGEGTVYFAQIDLHDLLEQIPDKKTFIPLPQYPGMERDWTITVDEALPYEEVVAHIEKLSSADCVGFRLQSIFRSDRIGKEKKNICMKFFYRNDTRTLVQEEVDAQFFALTQQISQNLTSSV